MISNELAAGLALYVVYAMDQYLADPTNLAPAPDPRLTPNWVIRGYLTASDCLLRKGAAGPGEERCYGYLAESLGSPGVFVAAIRGTVGLIEWLEDAEFSPMSHPAVGKVESGFWGIYASMTYRPVAGNALPAAPGVAAAIGPGSVTVVGHSLGAPLATYLAFDLAAVSNLGNRVAACLFASPRPGNGDFARAFDARVPVYRVFNYDLDLVPRVPVGPDYQDLRCVQWITLENSQAHIGLSVACAHHLPCYAAQLYYGLLAWSEMPDADDALVTCIKGPR